jgi:hypothetical protein
MCQQILFELGSIKIFLSYMNVSLELLHANIQADTEQFILADFYICSESFRTRQTTEL